MMERIEQGARLFTGGVTPAAAGSGPPGVYPVALTLPERQPPAAGRAQVQWLVPFDTGYGGAM